MALGGILGSVFGFISKPLDTVLKRVIKDKNLQMQMKHELEMELMKMPFEQMKLFEKRVVTEYEHPNLLRDAVRPVITYCCWGLYMYIKIVTVWALSNLYFPAINTLAQSGTIENLPQTKSLVGEFIESIFTQYDLYIILTILGFWFGSKLFERVIDKVGKTGGLASFFMGLKKGDNGLYKDDV